MKKSTAIVTAVLAVSSGMAMADFKAAFTQLTGISGAIHVDNTATGGSVNRNFSAGHFGFAYADVDGQRGNGQFSGGSFETFCIELQAVQGGVHTYDVTDIENGPNPAPGEGGPAYDAADQAEVMAVVSAAVDMGWINNDLSTASATLDQLAAIQGMIWKMVLDDAVVEAAAGQTDVAAAMADIQDYLDNNTWGTMSNLKAMLNPDSQDQLFIVPLPTAAFAGLITLGGVAGFSRIRRR